MLGTGHAQLMKSFAAMSLDSRVEGMESPMLLRFVREVADGVREMDFLEMALQLQGARGAGWCKQLACAYLNYSSIAAQTLESVEHSLINYCPANCREHSCGVHDVWRARI